MENHPYFVGRKFRKCRIVTALCLVATPAFAQTGIDTAFARKLYSAGHDDLFRVRVSLKNTAYWLYNDSQKLDQPIACDKAKQDCSSTAFRLVEVIDSAKTDSFFQRHEILATAEAKTFLSKPVTYASSYEVYISPTEVLFFMNDSLVKSLVDLGAAQPVSSLEAARPHVYGKSRFPAWSIGQWLLGRKSGPRPDALSKRP